MSPKKESHFKRKGKSLQTRVFQGTRGVSGKKNPGHKKKKKILALHGGSRLLDSILKWKTDLWPQGSATQQKPRCVAPRNQLGELRVGGGKNRFSSVHVFLENINKTWGLDTLRVDRRYMFSFVWYDILECNIINIINLWGGNFQPFIFLLLFPMFVPQFLTRDCRGPQSYL